MQKQEPKFEPFPVTPWLLNTQINSTSGGLQPGTTWRFVATSAQTYSINSPVTIKNVGDLYDSSGALLTVWVAEYSGNEFLGRRWIRKGTDQEEVTTQEGCDTIRFTFAYQSASGKSMTQDIIDQYFRVAIKKR